MKRPREAAKASTAPARDRELWIAGGFWGLWVVMPSLLLGAAVGKASAARAFISAQVGAAAVPYLSAAPHGSLRYLLVSYLLALPVVLLLAQQVRRAAGSADAPGFVVTLLLRRCAAFAALYLIGNAVVAVVMRARGVPGELVWGWAPRLALFGLFTTLPQLGWGLAVALAVRRFWLSLVLTLLGALVSAATGEVLAVKQIAFPTPILLRAELLSGKAEVALPALIGFVVWALGLALVGLGIRELRARRPLRTAAV